MESAWLDFRVLYRPIRSEPEDYSRHPAFDVVAAIVSSHGKQLAVINEACPADAWSAVQWHRTGMVDFQLRACLSTFADHYPGSQIIFFIVDTASREVAEVSGYSASELDADPLSQLRRDCQIRLEYSAPEQTGALLVADLSSDKYNALFKQDHGDIMAGEDVGSLWHRRNVSDPLDFTWTKLRLPIPKDFITRIGMMAEGLFQTAVQGASQLDWISLRQLVSAAIESHGSTDLPNGLDPEFLRHSQLTEELSCIQRDVRNLKQSVELLMKFQTEKEEYGTDIVKIKNMVQMDRVGHQVGALTALVQREAASSPQAWAENMDCSSARCNLIDLERKVELGETTSGLRNDPRTLR